MAAPFCLRERETIRAALMDAAMRHACAGGMKHTTVELLTEEVGISKGAFYHFFTSKEQLFLTVLENWYADIAENAAREYAHHDELPVCDRAALMLRTVIRLMKCRPLLRFIREDVPVLLRRLPQETLAEHFTSVDDFILSLIRRVHMPLHIDEQVAAAIIKTLMISVLYAEEIGANYEKAMDLTVQSVCTRLVAANSPV